MQKMTSAQREAFLKAKSEERRKIQARIDELVKQRQAYIQEEMRRQAGKGGFDEQVQAIVAGQARAKGIQYAASDIRK